MSEWMSEEMSHHISTGDIAIRLDLIGKVRGTDQAEKFFDSLPDTMRNVMVYGSLLNCYAHNKNLEKAESTMQTMRDLSFPMKTISYNVLMSLYVQLGKYDKLDVLMQEMRVKGIECDTYTYNIRLNAYASSSDIEGMENVLNNMESDARISVDWHSYVVAANGYFKAGLTEKVSQMLNKAEQIVPGKSKWKAYEVFLSLYTKIGRKDEVYRIWKLYGNLRNFRNSGYLCMISSLIKLDDIDGAQKILAEWESGYTLYDARVPNLMISAYCKCGLIAKAEAYTSSLIVRGVIKGPDAFTWNSLASGYQIDGRMVKAVEAMKNAILCSTAAWKPNNITLAACIDYLKGEKNTEAAEELLRLLRDRGLLSTDVHERLAIYIRDRNLDASALDLIKGDNQTLDEEVQGANECQI
ncbi:hypothetical protein COLO4_30180 [Corchorus olitorius]|uniref:Pentatricopeptide repeat-containing protein n=1 Tax=Corchorus olitorius TaxID=93759 RepID=A0A1R3HAS0_9ROSI|nr:hypothetical protein COLO4_30180 [Corchorus olitorius]